MRAGREPGAAARTRADGGAGHGRPRITSGRHTCLFRAKEHSFSNSSVAEKKCVGTERGEGRHSTAQEQTAHQREPNANTGEPGLMAAELPRCFGNFSVNWKPCPRVLQEAPCWRWFGEWTRRRPLEAPVQLDMAGAQR